MGNYIINNISAFDEDIVNLVLQSINYGSVWKNIRSVSKQIYNLSLKYQESKLIELANPILTLIYRYPNADWGYKTLVGEGIITIDFIRLTYNTIPWSKSLISSSSDITINDVINADPNSIDWSIISKNPSIKVSDMLKYDHLPWDYDSASKNTSIKIEDVINNPNKNWNIRYLSVNSSLTIEDLFTIMDPNSNNMWYHNDNTTYEDYMKYNEYPDSFLMIENFPLDEEMLQRYIDDYNPGYGVFINIHSITPKIIRNNPDINWDDNNIDYSKFTIEDVINIPVTNELNMARIFNHPDFTIEYFFEHFDINTFNDWHIIQYSYWITFDIVLKYKDIIPWNHKGLSMNTNVTIDILESDDFSWIKWDYNQLSYYAQLNFVYIIRHSNEDWNIMNLSMNKTLMPNIILIPRDIM